MFQKIYLTGFIIGGFLLSAVCFAENQPAQLNHRPPQRNFQSSASFRENLIGIINQLQAIKPLLNAAEKSQPKNSRIVLHFSPWQDASGKWHNGLRTDLIAIQTSLVHLVNRKAAEPRAIKPLKHDFISGTP